MARMAKLIHMGMATILLAGCTTMEERLALKKPSAQLAGVRIEDVSAYAATIVFDVDIINHYPETVPLRSFRYVVVSGDNVFVTGTADARINLPPGVQRTVSLPVRIDYMSAIKNLPNVGPGTTIPYSARLDLTVETPRLGTLLLNVSRWGNLNLPALSDTAELGPRGSKINDTTQTRVP